MDTSGAAASQTTAAAVDTLMANPGVLSGATVTSASFNGKTYTARSSSSSSSGSSNSSSQTNDTALIVGLVVGIVGATLLIVGSVFGFHQYHKKKKGQRLINDEYALENPSTSSNEQTRTIPRNVPQTNNNGVSMTRRVSASVQTVPISEMNRLRTISPTSFNEERVPSAARSVTSLEILTPKNPQAAAQTMPTPELIKFN